MIDEPKGKPVFEARVWKHGSSHVQISGRPSDAEAREAMFRMMSHTIEHWRLLYPGWRMKLLIASPDGVNESYAWSTDTPDYAQA